MKERIINIVVSFDMADIPEGSKITPKEKVKEMITSEMVELFSWDECYRNVEVTVTDK